MATLTATFDSGESRVRLELTGATSATTATYYRRLQGASTYDVVRGAAAVPVTSGTAIVVFDHEFPAGNPAATTVEYRTITNNSIDTTTTVAVDLSDQVWLKFPGFPFLNRPLTVVGRSKVTRASRGDLVPVVTARAAVAVQEFMAGRAYSVVVRTTTWSEFAELDAALALGGVVFLHGDEARLGLPSMFAVVTTHESEPGPKTHTEIRYTTIGLSEVAVPGYLYAGSVGTWQTLLSSYATWQLVLDEPTFTTWSTLLELEGSASDVIVS